MIRPLRFSVVFAVASSIWMISALPVGAATASAGVIYACVQRRGEEIRLVGPNESCRKHETRLQWNVAGQLGPAGPAGPAGADAPGLQTGELFGRVTACGGNVTRTLVYIPGRSFSAYTGADGRFILSGIPAGSYALVIEAPGQSPQTFAGATVTAGQTTDLGDIASTDTSSDPNNCGACGQVCGAGAACVSGACVVTCGAGATNCGGACVNLALDERNCGACGVTCGAGEACIGGSCAAPAPTCMDMVRNGTESDVDCGGNACGPCASGQACVLDRDCQTALCTSGVCQAQLGEGAPCSASSQCASGLYCGGVGVCEQQLPSGSDCSGDEQCLSFLCTTDSMCW